MSNSPRNAANSNPTTFKERDNWMRAVLAADLPHAAARVAVAIALRLHVNNGKCNPAYKTIAADSRVSERSVYRHVELLEQAGWITAERTVGRPNDLGLTTPAKAMAEVPQKMTPAKAMAEDPCQIEKGPLPKLCQGTPANKVADNKESKRAKRTAGAYIDHPPGLFAGVSSKKEAREEGRKEDHAEVFDQFWNPYPRKVAKEAARKAFDAAVKQGVAAETLIAGAKRYAGERAGEDPQFTKHPATWLRGGCWEDEPPRDGGPPTIDGATGEIIPAAPRRRRKGDMTWEECGALAIARLNGDERPTDEILARLNGGSNERH
jgi:Helix-turn-helix domain